MVFHRLCVQLSFTCSSCVGGSGVGDIGVVSVVKEADDNAVFFVMVRRRDKMVNFLLLLALLQFCAMGTDMTILHGLRDVGLLSSI